jgi:hypothetical protein
MTSIRSTALAAALACSGLLLSACGGGGDASAPSATSTGVFFDSPVGGLTYTASPSGRTGTTNAAGEFTYVAGDTVTFSVGNLAIGSTTGSATIKPANLSTDVNRVSNILVLLQSLDADGNPDNGIALPSTLPSLATVNLALAPATFASGANTALQAAVTAITPAGDPPRTIVASTTATEAAQRAFYAAISGVWRLDIDGNSRTILRFDARGNYLHGRYDTAFNGGETGIELGSLTWSPLTQGTTFQVLTDTNGSWGFSNPSGTVTMKLSGDKLVVQEGTSTAVTYRRTGQSDTTLAGSYALTGDDISSPLFLFSNDGFFVLDPQGDREAGSCGGPGVETGNYTWNASTGAFAVTFVGWDTNGCAGLLSGGASYASAIVKGAGNSLGFTEEGVADAWRVQRLVNTPATLPLGTQAAFWSSVSGAWRLNVTGSSNTLLRLDAFGNYLTSRFRTNADTVPIGQAPSGVELGSLTRNPTTGAITATAKLDTNGSFGLSDIGSTATLTLGTGTHAVTNASIETLTLTGAGGTLQFRRLGRVDVTPLVGIWALGNPSLLNTHLLSVSDTSFSFSDPQGDLGTSLQQGCGQPGIEVADYTLNGGTFTIGQIYVDTNGCAGLNDAGTTLTGSISYGANNDSFTLTSTEGPLTFYRVLAGH